METNNFGRWLQRQLDRRELTKSDFARALDRAPARVSEWLNGDRVPSTRSCDLIADALSVDLDTVLAVAGHRPMPDVLKADDPRSDLIAMIRRIELTPDRLATLDSTLRTFLRMDRLKAEQEQAGIPHHGATQVTRR